MNKSQLIDSLSKKTKMTKKKSEIFINTFMEQVGNNLKHGKKVVLVGFGTFQVYKRKATSGINPQTRKKIDIPAKKVAKLKWSDTFNQFLNHK